MGTLLERCLVATVVVAAAMAFSGRIGAEEDVAVPFPMQAEVLSKAAGYDKNLPARAGDKVHVLILKKEASAESARASAQIERALAEKIKDIGGISYDVATSTYTTPADLARACTAGRISIVYVTPGLGEEVSDLARGLSGTDVLTVSAVAPHVAKGIVLGFELVSSKLKLDVNLAQARRQHVAFSAELLQFAKVIE